MPSISQHILHGGIRDNYNELPDEYRQGIADFAGMLAESALLLGRERVDNLIVLFARLVADFPQEIAPQLRQLTDGLEKLEKRARERTSINIGQAQDIVSGGGTKNVRNINMNNDIKE